MAKMTFHFSGGETLAIHNLVSVQEATDVLSGGGGSPITFRAVDVTATVVYPHQVLYCTIEEA